MSTLALTSGSTSSRRQVWPTQRPHPLMAVITWEFRRFRASRLFWFQVLGLFCFLLLLTWLQGTAAQYSRRDASGFIPGTSAWGLLLILPTEILLLVLVLPFVAADGVTRDLTRRTHELLMVTPLPGWAYVWGRYLVGLAMSLGLSILLLAAILAMGVVQHLTIAAYPAPQIAAVLPLWIGMVVPATVLVSSLSFALCTLFPRMAAVIKTAMLVGWVAGAEILPFMIFFPLGPSKLPLGYSRWDPTSAITALVMLRQYAPDISPQTNAAQLQQVLNAVANQIPDISSWLVPHLIEAGLGFLLVLLTSFTFQRFRNAFNS